MGFCFFNNVAVGALHAAALGCARVLVLDWDVHHGNGIEEILYERPDILYVSLHRHEFSLFLAPPGPWVLQVPREPSS